MNGYTAKVGKTAKGASNDFMLNVSLENCKRECDKYSYCKTFVNTTSKNCYIYKNPSGYNWQFNSIAFLKN